MLWNVCNINWYKPDTNCYICFIKFKLKNSKFVNCLIKIFKFIDVEKTKFKFIDFEKVKFKFIDFEKTKFKFIKNSWADSKFKFNPNLVAMNDAAVFLLQSGNFHSNYTINSV